MADLTIEDLKAVIRDTVKEQVAARMTDAVEKAADAAPPVVRPDFRDQADAGRSSVSPISFEVLHDPHKGKGLGFARSIKALATARAEGADPRMVAQSWAKAGHRHYAEVAERMDMVQRAMGEGSLSAGGSLVPTNYSSEIIELLYAKTLSLELGARTMDIVRNQTIGKLNSGATVSYIGEGANITPSTPATGSVSLSAKKAAALVPINNELMRNPSVGADTLVRDDLVAAMARRRDLSFFRGAGDSYQPRGMKLRMASANAVAMTGTPTTTTKIGDLIGLVALVDGADVDLSSGGFAMSPRTYWGLWKSLDGNAQFVFAQMLAAGTLFGFKVGRSTQIPNNLGGGSESEVYFGAFADAIMGFDVTAPMSVDVFPNGAYHDGSAVVSGISADQTVIRILEGHDVTLRHDTAFAMLTGVTWS